MKDALRALIADDHPLTREGLALALRTALPGATIDQAGSIGEAQAAARAHPPASTDPYRLVLLDLMLPDARGFSGFVDLHRLLDGVPVVIVSARQDAMLVDAARSLGAAGYLFKSRPLDEIAAALGRIAGGERVFPPTCDDPATTEARSRLASLSAAQLRVLLAMADGRLNKQIAGDLAVTEATIKAHLTAIFRKLGVHNRTQALLAIRPLVEGNDQSTDG